MINAKTRKNKPKNNKKTKPKRINDELLLHQLIIPKLPKELMKSSPFPVSMTRKLLFHERVILQGAVPFIVKDYILNGAFLPSGIAGNFMTGFAQLAAIYNVYIVIKARFKYIVNTNEPGVPIYFGVICRDIQPSTTILSWANANDSLEMSPTTGIQSVGETTGMGTFRSKWYQINPSEIYGNPLQYYTSNNVSSVVTANPGALIFGSFILTSDLVGTNLTNGAFLDFYLELTTMFYSLKNLAS